MVKILVENGADVNAEDFSRMRPISWAIIVGNSSKTNFKHFYNKKNCQITFIYYEGHNEIVKYLIEKGTKIHDDSETEFGLIFVAIKSSNFLSIFFEEIKSEKNLIFLFVCLVFIFIFFLFFLFFTDKTEIVKLLIDNGVNVNVNTTINSDSKKLELTPFLASFISSKN